MTASSSLLSVGYETSAGPKPPGCSAAKSASFSSNAFAAALSRPPSTAPPSIATAARMRGSFEKSSAAAISGSVKRTRLSLWSTRCWTPSGVKLARIGTATAPEATTPR